MKTYRSYHWAFRMDLVISLEYLVDLRSWRIVDPLNRSWCHHNRLYLMLLNDRCCLSPRQCFGLAMMPDPDAFSVTKWKQLDQILMVILFHGENWKIVNNKKWLYRWCRWSFKCLSQKWITQFIFAEILWRGIAWSVKVFLWTITFTSTESCSCG